MLYIRKALFNLLKKKKLDKILVKDVCEAANISRQTFYYYFGTLSDVFMDWVKENLERLLNEKDSYASWLQGYGTLLKFCADNKEPFMNVYLSSYRSELIDVFKNYGYRIITLAVERVSIENRIPMIQTDKEFMVKFYLNIYVGILEDFFESGLKDDVDYISSLCEVMLGNSIYEKERQLFELYWSGRNR